MRRERTPTGAPSWIDLMSADTERARAFYGGLFGWECEDPNPEFGGYANFTLDGIRIAGLMTKMEPGMPDVWSAYIDVPDAQAAADRVTANGGQIFVPPQPVGDLGTMVVAADVGGGVIGMWEAGAHAGFGVHNEPNAPAWFELLTPAYEASLDFYRVVFDWNLESVSDGQDFRYTVMKIGELQYAGIMDITGVFPDGTPPCWQVYFQVADADASSETLLALGGTVERPAEDTPYGRLVSCADPMGARFNLIQSNE